MSEIEGPGSWFPDGRAENSVTDGSTWGGSESVRISDGAVHNSRSLIARGVSACLRSVPVFDGIEHGPEQVKFQFQQLQGATLGIAGPEVFQRDAQAVLNVLRGES